MKIVEQHCIGYSKDYKKSFFKSTWDNGDITYAWTVHRDDGTMVTSVQMEHRPYVHNPVKEI